MTEGFGGFIDKKVIDGDGKARVVIDDDEVGKLLKKYKKIKKYMKSSVFQVRTMNGTERMVQELIDEYNENPLD